MTSGVAGPLPPSEHSGIGSWHAGRGPTNPMTRMATEALAQPSSVSSSEKEILAECPITGAQKGLAAKVSEVAQTLIRSLGRTQVTDFKLSKLGTTMNPVARLEEPIFVPRQALGSGPAKSSMEVIREAIGKIYPEMAKQGLGRNELLQWVAQTYDECPDRHSGDDAKLLAEFKQKTAEIASNKMGMASVKLLHQALASTAIQVKVEGAPRFYDREEAISALRSQAEATGEDLSSTIAALESSEEAYIEEGVLPTAFQEKLTVYYHSYDLMAVNDFNPEVRALLGRASKVVRSSGGPGFAVKAGIENQRELLAQRLNAVFSLTPALLPKVAQPLPKASIQDVQLADALVSEWLEGGQDIDRDAWVSYLEAKRHLALSRGSVNEEEALRRFEERAMVILNMDGGPRQVEASKLHALQRQLKALDNFTPTSSQERSRKQDQRKFLEKQMEPLQETLSQMAVKSGDAMELAILDLELTSYDSHIHQVKFVEGEPRSYDFSRFLMPGIAMEGDDGEIRAFLRSDMLDHPAVFGKEIPQALVEKWKALTPEVIEQRMQEEGLLDSRESFDARGQELDRLRDYRDVLGWGTDEKVQEVARDLGVTTDSRTELRGVVNNRIEEVQRQAFQRVHPVALEAWKIKAERRVRYLEAAGPKTIEGLRNAMYPEFAPFFRVLEKESGNPGTRLAFRMEAGHLQLRSLEAIIRDAEQSMADGHGYATDQEIQEMKEALGGLRASGEPLVGSCLDVSLTAGIAL